MDHLGSPYGPDLLRGLLSEAGTIALVGASPDAWRPAFGIMRYLQSAGYRVIPVNPNHAGDTLNGERVVADLASADAKVDLVNVFRRSDALAGIVAEAIAIGRVPVWAQLGVVSSAAAALAEDAGLTLVMNRCISVEHARLMR